MKLARLGKPDGERPAAGGADGVWRDLVSITPDISRDFLREGIASLRSALPDLPELDAPSSYRPPLADPGKIVCIGLNYRDHARETGADIPTEPIIFLKAPYTVIGPNDDVLIPRRSKKTDWEVELAIVIGAEARYLRSPAEADQCILGYAISNDVSEREFQIERGGQWDKGKNCETFNPFGPWIVTADEIDDPERLGLRLWVNGELRQDGNTKDMIFSPSYLVWYVSQFMVLEPGDVINSGTPAGVALGSPGVAYLKSGDLVELEIDGLGTQRQIFR